MIINYYLRQTPPELEGGLGQYLYFILDGTFLHRPLSLITLMDAQTNTVLTGAYPVSERSEPQLLAFFRPLIQRGLSPVSFTIDGSPKVIRVLKKLWPDVVIQRCLVHIQRQGLAWCRSYPKTTYARKLRDISLQVTRIRTPEARDQFLAAVTEWEERYGRQVADRAESGPVFSDIKRARSMLLRALPDMFHYLEQPEISFTTNGLEGYYSRLKGRYRQHRGLSKQKRQNYFLWFFLLVPK